MKLQITQSKEDLIEGFHNILWSEDGIDLSPLSDNECELIILNGILQKVLREDISAFLAKILTKLRLNGVLEVSGVEVDCLFKHYLNDNIKIDAVSKVIQNCNSAISISELTKIIQSLGLKVQSAKINGVNYEIRAKRS